MVVISFAYLGLFLIFNVIKMDNLRRAGNVTRVFLNLIGSLDVYRFMLI